MQGPDAAALAAEVNRTVAAAVDRAKQVPGIKVQTLNYETYPVNNDKGQFTGWRVRQTIKLETQDTAQLSALLGELQQTLNLDSIQYSVSPESLKKVEDALISDALQAFQQRAELVTHDLGRSEYGIATLRVNTNPQPPIVYRQAAAAGFAAPAPPAIEPGTGKVEVEVSGQIERQPQ